MRINLNSRNVTDLMNEIELPTITLVLSLVLYLPAGTSRCSGVDLGARTWVEDHRRRIIGGGSLEEDHWRMVTGENSGRGEDERRRGGKKILS